MRHKKSIPNRNVRIADQIPREVAQILREQVKDPRLDLMFVTVTGVEVTPDYGYAKVFYSVLNESSDLEKIQAALTSARGFVKTALGRAMLLRVTPEISFVYDNTTIKGVEMSALIDVALLQQSKD